MPCSRPASGRSIAGTSARLAGAPPGFPILVAASVTSTSGSPATRPADPVAQPAYAIICSIVPCLPCAAAHRGASPTPRRQQRHAGHIGPGPGAYQRKASAFDSMPQSRVRLGSATRATTVQLLGCPPEASHAKLRRRPTIRVGPRDLNPASWTTTGGCKSGRSEYTTPVGLSHRPCGGSRQWAVASPPHLED